MALSKLCSTVDTLLNDPSTEELNQNADRMAATVTANAGNIVQAAVRPGAPLDPHFSNKDPDQAMAYYQSTFADNISKLIPIGNASWTDNQNRGDSLLSKPLPKALWEYDSMPASGIAKYFKYVRTGFQIMVQINCPSGVAGSALVVYLPKPCVEQDGRLEFSTFTNLPHVVLNVATTTQATLFIPYTCHANFVGVGTSDLGAIRVYVWTKLSIPSNSPNEITLTMLAGLIDPNFQCPRPYNSNQMPNKIITPALKTRPQKAGRSRNTKFKWCRNKYDIAEGPGSMNLANRLSTNGAQSIALVGERAIYDPTLSGQKRRAMDMLEIARLPSVYGNQTFEWRHNQNVGDGIDNRPLGLAHFANLRNIAEAYQFYRGSVVLTLTVFNSSFNKGRLRFCFFPLRNANYNYQDSFNSINVVCDIGLNSSFDLTIPFTSDTWMRQTSQDLGRVIVFVENKLTYNAAAPLTLQCMLQGKAGDDFQFFVPTEATSGWQMGPSWGSLMDLNDPLSDDEEAVKESNTETFESDETTYQNSDSMAASAGLTAIENKGTLADIVNSSQPMFKNFEKCQRPVFTVSHTRIDNIFGRGQRVGNHTWSALGIFRMELDFPIYDHLALGRFFNYWAGELNVHILNHSDQSLAATHTYDQDRKLDSLQSSGTIIIPRWSAMTLSCPFYSRFAVRPVRAIDGLKSLGLLRCRPEAANGTVIVYVSFRNPNFFVPAPAAQRSTGRAVMMHSDLRQDLTHHDVDVLAEQDMDEPFRNSAANLENPVSRYFNQRLGHRLELLKLSGDIEENPGPLSNEGNESSWIVFKPRGFYKHYGIQHGDTVYHLDSADISQAILQGKCKFQKTESSGSWQKAFPVYLDYFLTNNLESMVGDSYTFSFDTNCETIVADLFPQHDWLTQTQAMKLAAGIIICASVLAYCTPSYTINDLKEMFQLSSENNEGAMPKLVQKCMSYFSSVFTETFASDISRIIVKCVVRLLCYIVMYCHSPNLLTSICLGTLVIMDVTSAGPISSDTQAILKSLFEGDIRKFAECVVEKIQYPEGEDEIEMKQATIKAAANMFAYDGMEDEAPDVGMLKDFNTFSNAGKNAEWWIGTLRKAFNFLKEIFSPSENKRCLDWMEDHHGIICDLLATVNDHIVDTKKPQLVRDPKFHTKHIWLCRRMNEIAAIAVKSATHTPLASTIVRMASELHKIKLATPVNNATTRMEPVGIWVTGEPGQGKSFFSQSLIKLVCKKTGLKGVFTNPTGSEFMDGYAGQDVHIIDDAGQNREEKDLALLCQCISSIPFTVPMADLTEKGCQYTSKLVVATSNRTTFTTTVLSDPDALRRRFPFYYRIRAKQQFCKNGKLDVPNSMKEMPFGTPWEMTDDGYLWKPVDMEKLATEVAQEIARREESISKWNKIMEDEGFINSKDFKLVKTLVEEEIRTLDELMDDFYASVCGEESPFDCLSIRPSQKLQKSHESVKKWFLKKLRAVKKWAAANVGWLTLVSIFATGISLVAAVVMYSRRDKKDTEQRPYNPQTTNPKGGAVFQTKPNQPIVLSNQSPYNGEIEHCFQNVCYITGDNMKGSSVIHCLAWRQRQLITYGHVHEWLNDLKNPKLLYKNSIFLIEQAEIRHVSIQDQAMDLLVINLPKLPIQFKDISRYLSSTISKDSYLIWNTPTGRIMYQVDNPYLSGGHVSVEGTHNAKSITYCVNSKKGMCGGVLISRIEGNFKITGMHIAGNGVVGCAAALGDFARIVNDQGAICTREPAPVRVHQPARTQIHPNMLHQLWPVTMGPSVLTPKDNRLEVKLDSVIKACSEDKYIGNTFCPDLDIFEQAVNNVSIKFQKLLGVHDCVDKRTAIEGFGGLNKLDLNTSAGIKYSTQGLGKRDLIRFEPFWIHPKLDDDIDTMFFNLMSGEIPQTVFGTYLKDELRKLKKIATGKTRTIEACSVDYTICHRMVMGSLYEAIYKCPAQLLGCAVGMNPWTDFDSLIRSLFPNCYCFDFSAWDGSLSADIMRAGVSVLANCHQNPVMVTNLMEPIVVSKQLCLDEIFTVDGGMPSGAPCTTILNSVVNLLICEYASLKMGVTSLCVTYGDDLVFSTPFPIDSSMVTQMWHCEFGMTATAADKSSDVVAVQPMHIEFLKRTPTFFPYSGLITGKLDLDNLKQHIMWSKSSETFEQQLTSFENELVLHGQEVYDNVREQVMSRLGPLGKVMITFPLAYKRMLSYVFE
nr:polyprotein [Bat parechovirus]